MSLLDMMCVRQFNVAKYQSGYNKVKLMIIISIAKSIRKKERQKKNKPN